MIKKYRVHEVAKNLNVPNKEIIAVVKEHFGVEKKYMTALTDDELNVVLEFFTQKNQLKNFDKYFEYKGEVEESVDKDKKTQQKARDRSKKSSEKNIEIEKKSKANKASVESKKNEKKSDKIKDMSKNKKTLDESKKVEKRLDKIKDIFKNKKTSDKNEKVEKKTDEKAKTKKTQLTQNKGIKNANAKTENKKINKSNQKPKNNTTNNSETKTEANNSVKKVKSRVINTRAVQVDIEKYNEKYDRMASEKMKTDSVIRKQKISQRSQNRGKPKNSRKETEAERLRRIALERKAKPITVQIPESITIGELAIRLKATASEVIKKLMLLGTMASINDVIDFDTASLVAMEFHAKVEKEVVVTIEERIIDDSEDDDENLVPRSPVVVVMGHVDHGKTSLLDAIRNTQVTTTEAGGITQHIGAYRVPIDDKEITFLDTPGHEAFTTMRARGAQVTDIAVLVVAADDGIMPQTIEAINHAKAAGVSIIVAINKIDKPGANPENVKKQLTEYELVPEEWGGNIPCIPVSAKKRTGIEDLLEMIILVAELKELKANPNRRAKGTVIEARLDKGRGPISTVLVQNGTLHVGDIIVAGTTVGRVRAMMNERGRRVKEAGPSVPVEITGLNDVPVGGDVFNAVSDEKLARELVDERIHKLKEKKFNSQTKVTLDNLFDQMKQGEMKELKVIVKADVQGSVEAVRQSLEKLSGDEVRVNVIHGAVGAINESDVMLADASNAIIVGFNVRPDQATAENAERAGVDMRLYRVIYDCIEEIQSAMKGMLEPKYREVQLGSAECRKVYKISGVGTISGSYVLSGKITRNASIRVVRDGIVVAEDSLSSLRRFKDDVKEVAQGYECGIGLEKFNDIKEGDVFEAFIMEEYRED